MSGSPSPGPSASAPQSATASTSASPTPAPNVLAVAKKVHADELGQVPVLMYHQLVANPAGDRYNQTPAAFLAEMTRLERDGYVPVTAADYVAGRIDVPAGKHPVVLTFDDSTRSQFGLGADGKPLPTTAVGILVAFAAAHPDFPAHATFFVNNAGWGTNRADLKWLHDNGFEVAVHTVSHANLANLTDAQVQHEIGGNFAMIEAAIGSAPTTFALPYGAYAKRRTLEMAGTSGGVSYHLAGVFLVGSNPAHSPYAKTFDPAGIPRIRSQSTPGGPNDMPYESAAELTVLEQHPERLFTSDGDPAVVSYPKASAKYAGKLPAGMATNAY
jgi:peptidoglycan/xylan/chitin deacetylase (PgdA/CDA1 family)